MRRFDPARLALPCKYLAIPLLGVAMVITSNMARGQVRVTPPAAALSTNLPMAVNAGQLNASGNFVVLPDVLLPAISTRPEPS